jgi:hypothetical protein
MPANIPCTLHLGIPAGNVRRKNDASIGLLGPREKCFLVSFYKSDGAVDERHAALQKLVTRILNKRNQLRPRHVDSQIQVRAR